MSQQASDGQPTEQAQDRVKQDDFGFPEGALVSYEQVSLGIRVYTNYRWILYHDGRWFLGRNRATYGGQKGQFESDLPSTPTKVLPPAVVLEVEDQLRAADFPRQPSQQPEPTMQDGAQVTITARLHGQVHQITCEGSYPPFVTYLMRFAWRYEGDSRP